MGRGTGTLVLVLFSRWDPLGRTGFRCVTGTKRTGPNVSKGGKHEHNTRNNKKFKCSNNNGPNNSSNNTSNPRYIQSIIFIHNSKTIQF